mmetsp:Transcript_3635/g.4457  ORF Transcript_3635/g.4457 Transcript_3635/m.4457 type:complete len:152 (+) Transcript_3635:63-518(+)
MTWRCILVVIAPLLQSTLAQHMLQGVYCKNILNAGHVYLRILDDTHADASGAMFGIEMMCHNERFVLDRKTLLATLPDSGDPSNCVNREMSNFGAAPSSLKIIYFPGADWVELTLPLLGTAFLNKEDCPGLGVVDDKPNGPTDTMQHTQVV